MQRQPGLARRRRRGRGGEVLLDEGADLGGEAGAGLYRTAPPASRRQRRRVNSTSTNHLA